MKFAQCPTILSFGTYIPPHRISTQDIEKKQGKKAEGTASSLGIVEKSVPSVDEDAITLAVEAGLECLQTISEETKSHIGAMFIGSESHPYAVKPSGTVVASALGLPKTLAMADLQFACKAGMQSLLASTAYVQAGMARYGLAIGSDTAQAKPGDAMEFSAAAGAACFLVGSSADRGKAVAEILGTVSIATDTPDFWRRPGFDHPNHAGRFTGEPAFFAHITYSVNTLLSDFSILPSSVTWAGFHTPNAKFPQTIAKKLGFSSDQLQHSLQVKNIGNTYAAASLLVLANILRHAEKDDLILVASYGSGAGSDAILLRKL